MKEYDMFIPLSYNDGTPIDEVKLQALQHRLLQHFGGLTFFPQPNEGFWTMGDVTYRDEIVIYRVFTSKKRAARQFLVRLKRELKNDLEQQEIVERDVERL